MVDPLSYFHSSQCSITGVTNAVVCVWDDAYKRILGVNLISPYGGSRFSLTV